MRARLLILTTVPLLLAGCFSVRPPSLGAVTELLKSEEWEYRQEIDCRDTTQSASTAAGARTAMMNDLGKKRWELVAIQPLEVPPSTATAGAQSCAVFTFKRRVD